MKALKPAANRRYFIYCANHFPIDIYCTEVLLSFCNDMNENFESAGESLPMKQQEATK